LPDQKLPRNNCFQLPGLAKIVSPQETRPQIQAVKASIPAIVLLRRCTCGQIFKAAHTNGIQGASQYCRKQLKTGRKLILPAYGISPSQP
jgi:hypothetical protein